MVVDDEPSFIESLGPSTKPVGDFPFDEESDDDSILNGSGSEYQFQITVAPFPELVAKTLRMLHGQSDVDDCDLHSSTQDQFNRCTISRVSQEGIEMWKRVSLSSSNFDDREPCRFIGVGCNQCSHMQDGRSKRALC